MLCVAPLSTGVMTVNIKYTSAIRDTLAVGNALSCTRARVIKMPLEWALVIQNPFHSYKGVSAGQSNTQVLHRAQNLKSLFIEKNGYYIPTEHAASPWGPVTLHGGASAGLMTSLLEEQFPTDTMQLVRLTVDLFRPVPMAALEPRSRIIRDGKRIKVLAVSLFHGDQEICRSNALIVEKQNIQLPVHAQLARQPPQKIVDAFAQDEVIGINAINKAAGVTYPPGLHTLIPLKPIFLNMGVGRGCSWVRLPLPVREGLENSPLVSAATLSDFSNGFAQLYLSPNQGFINADITLNLHRLPVDEWIAIDAHTRAQPHGVSVVEAVLYDHHGMFGRVSQSNMTMATYSE